MYLLSNKTKNLIIPNRSFLVIVLVLAIFSIITIFLLSVIETWRGDQIYTHYQLMEKGA